MYDVYDVTTQIKKLSKLINKTTSKESSRLFCMGLIALRKTPRANQKPRMPLTQRYSLNTED